MTEVSGEVKLQSLVDHTTQRLVTPQKDMLKECLVEYDPNKITIAFKWGCDGASGHSQYMQGFENSDNNDASLYLVSLVPLRRTVLLKTGN
ncbi:hypothetical protein J437_LFUL010256 [Ladona fulva]|uniref:Uncharacterized protein n=1 Tax=Ladona fulva TaxID=123851 RepID=A0A8K0KEV5_LADFU|nr:hypothetical protein J437_LFUL010256 [Ladona fulva]